MSTTSKQESFIANFHQVVVALMAQGKVTLIDIAEQFHITRGQLNRRVKSAMGITAQQLALDIRIDHAKRLLETSPLLPIGDVAFQCGFEDATSFTRAFHRATDCSPSHYRNINKKT